MKILFVCRGNVGRSQVAAALFNKYTGLGAFSAGTKVFEKEGLKLKNIDLVQPVIKFMKQEGVNVAENSRKQITPEMVDGFDKIIVMAEPETVPNYLLNDKTVFWSIEDLKGQNDTTYINIISQIKSKLYCLIKENNIKTKAAST